MDITPEILEKCARDDRKAIQILYEYCFKLLMPVCFRYHNNEEDARSSFNLGFIISPPTSDSCPIANNTEGTKLV